MKNHCFDSVFEILTLLPAKSLMRFICVSKAWNTLIRHDVNFFKSHLARSQARSTATRLLFELEVCPHSKEDVVLKLNEKLRLEGFPLELLAPRHYFCDKEMRICSNYCNGLVCLYSYKDTQAYLYNVTTGEIKALPISVKLDPQLFLGFDLVTEKYKLVHIILDKSSKRLKTRILTLGTDSSWRKVDGWVYCPSKPWRCIFLKGVVYSTNDVSCISYFNFREEKFGLISNSPLQYSFNGPNIMQTALLGKLVMQCWFHRNGKREDSDCTYDEVNKVFTVLDNPTNLEEEKVAMLEAAEKIDKSKQAHVLATSSIINIPASLTFPNFFRLKHVTSFVENIIPLSSLV